jgi:hypothetical protein
VIFDGANRSIEPVSSPDDENELGLINLVNAPVGCNTITM